MSDDPRYVSNVAFTDLLFNIVVGLAFLFLLAFILMNPIAKEKDVEEKSDFIIVMTWDDESGDDIDLWVRDPLGNILSFRNRGVGFMHLDRDDLGLSNDKVMGADGKTKYVYRNKEVASLRGYHVGTYLVNAHVYNKKRWKDNKMRRSNIKIELIKLNPFHEVAQAEFVAIGRGQEFTAFRFTLNADGEVTKVDNEREPMIGAQSVYGVGNNTNELDLSSGYGGGYYNLPDSQPEASRWIESGH